MFVAFACSRVRALARSLIKSETGTGKTLAYLLPVVERLGGEQPRVQRGDGVRACVLAPTRELCIQIHRVLEQVLRAHHWIIAGTVMGGEKKKSEKSRLRKGVNVLVATPGRLKDHLENTVSLKLDRMQWLILDEADRCVLPPVRQWLWLGTSCLLLSRALQVAGSRF